MKISKLIRSYMVASVLAITFSVVAFENKAYALEEEAITKIGVLREGESVVKEKSEKVEKKSTEVEKTEKEVKSIEEKKESLKEEIERLKKEIEEAEKRTAEEKARVEAERLAQIEAQRIASLPVAVATPSAQTNTFAPVVSRNYSVSSSGNSYAWGQCTWYVKNRRPDIGSFWGNADMWVYSARAAGYSTGSVPVAGAIGQEHGQMHVVYVEAVRGNMVDISEMNYAGGVGVVHYRTVPANSFTYIY